MHAEQDYLTFSACTELAERGYTVLCANNDASKSGYMTDLDFENMMQDVALGVTLPKADGIVLVDANYGVSTMTHLSLNPAIMDERNGRQINSSLDLYSPANGFTDTGANYSAAFTKAFQSGVAARMNRLIEYAEGRLDAINSGNGTFSDDEELYIPDALYTGNNNKLFAQDTRLLSHTSQAWPLLHKNGSSTIQVVYSVRVASNFQSVADSYLNGALKTTVKRFLGALAIRVSEDFSFNEDSLTGIEWTSSHMVPVGAVPGITVPLLTMGMTGHWEYLNAEKIYLNSGSNDTSIAFVEGAEHTINTCTACESYPGEFGDTTKTAYDRIAQWLGNEGRFI
ncbi:hypothetical protein SLS56_009464 [Neofusicoccum ribis]|uniref:Uncharacterized protein n=1 Tax=Neofusicoccum ribis TaxID=45134 RepID=A0ABR3SH64_9PEZI